MPIMYALVQRRIRAFLSNSPRSVDTWVQTFSSLQSAAVPCRDARTTPRSENNWNQFKDTHYHGVPCLPHPLSPLRLVLPLHIAPFFWWFSSCTTWALQGCRHNLGHSARPHFSHPTQTCMQSHASPSVYYLTPPGGSDSITELNSDPASTAWPEKRDAVCVLEKDRVKGGRVASSWNEARQSVGVRMSQHISSCVSRRVCVCVWSMEERWEGCVCLKWHLWPPLLSPLYSPVCGTFSTLHMFVFFSWTQVRNNAHQQLINIQQNHSSF